MWRVLLYSFSILILAAVSQAAFAKQYKPGKDYSEENERYQAQIKKASGDYLRRVRGACKAAGDKHVGQENQTSETANALKQAKSVLDACEAQKGDRKRKKKEFKKAKLDESALDHYFLKLELSCLNQSTAQIPACQQDPNKIAFRVSKLEYEQLLQTTLWLKGQVESLEKEVAALKAGNCSTPFVEEPVAPTVPADTQGSRPGKTLTRADS